MNRLSSLAIKIGKTSAYLKNQTGVLIIGNGFDLDLKRTITFDDFYNSEFWPREEQLRCPLSSYLDLVRSKEQWFDIEKALSDYVDVDNNSIEREPNKDMIFYDKLVEGLSKYASSKTIETFSIIQENRGRQVKDMPLAYLVLEAIILSPFRLNYNIFSFNYTELESLINLVYINNGIDKSEQKQIAFLNRLEYTHGSLATRDIILGAKNESTYAGLELIRKTNRLKNTTIVDRLDKANQVIFFGHSLSSVDRCYFDTFFESIANGNTICRKIIICTYDNNSKLNIKQNLKEFYGIDWDCPIIEYYTIADYIKEVSINHPLPILNKIENLSF